MRVGVEPRSKLDATVRPFDGPFREAEQPQDEARCCQARDPRVDAKPEAARSIGRRLKRCDPEVQLLDRRGQVTEGHHDVPDDEVPVE